MSPADRRRAEVLETLRRLAATGGREAAQAIGRLLGRPTTVDEDNCSMIQRSMSDSIWVVSSSPQGYCRRLTDMPAA